MTVGKFFTLLLMLAGATVFILCTYLTKDNFKYGYGAWFLFMFVIYIVIVLAVGYISYWFFGVSFR